VGGVGPRLVAAALLVPGARSQGELARRQRARLCGANDAGMRETHFSGRSGLGKPQLGTVRLEKPSPQEIRV